MSQTRLIGALYFLGAALFGIPAALLIGAVMLYHFVVYNEAEEAWAGSYGLGFLGLISLAVAYWLGHRGLDYWRRDE